MRIAVLTASLPERQEMLQECLASVQAQLLPPAGHFVCVDYERAGCIPTMNRLWRSVANSRMEWLALLGDDDIAYPNHLSTLAWAADDADIVYSWCDVVGRDWNPNSYFDPDRLQHENYIPSTTLIRSALVKKLGGWREEAAHGFEDWDFWLRALDVGARIVCVPTITWAYRFHGRNQSWGGVGDVPTAVAR